MRKLVTIIALLCCTFCAFAQEAGQQEDPKVTQMRKDIGIDYSMPDFETKKIDAKVISYLGRYVQAREQLNKYCREAGYMKNRL